VVSEPPIIFRILSKSVIELKIFICENQRYLREKKKEGSRRLRRFKQKKQY